MSTADDDPFPFGVASGDPTADSVVIWTTTPADTDEAVRWEVATDAAFADVVASGDVASGTEGSYDHATSLPASTRVTGLDAETTYRYRFIAEADGSEPVRSTVGLTRTLPFPDADDVERFRIGLACCARLPVGPLVAYDGLADAEPDLVVHLGDYVYEDDEAPHDPPTLCVSERDYRRRYEQYRRDPSLQRLHATAPWVAEWDDHEVADDAWDGGSPDDATDDETEAWAQRVESSKHAYFDWMPQQPSGNGPTDMDRVLRIGKLAHVVVLDARLGGREKPDGGSSPSLVDPDDDRAILSDDQWAWLAECVETRRETPGWFVLCTQTQVSPLHLARLPKPSRRFRFTPLVNPDQWDGYPVERERLVRLLDPIADRTLICSGDLHGRFHTGLRTPGGHAIPEITSPSIGSVPFAEAIREKLPIPTSILRRWLAHLNPHIGSMNLTDHGSTVLDISAARIDVISLDAAGSEVRRWPAAGG